MTVKVKICGITRVEDAVLATQFGASAIGMVFYAPSPRYIKDLSIARDIALAVGPLSVVVGLFVNAGVGEVEKILTTVPLHLLQFHGDEDNAYCCQFNRPFIKAIRMKKGIDVINEMQQFPDASGFLLDAYQKGVPGGTGESFDWARFPKQMPEQIKVPVILAGGLNCDNVTEAVKVTEPYGIDVSGGVESCPSVKDSKLMESFICQAHNVIR